MSRNRRGKHRRRRFEEGEELNPMNYLSNLSDAMLVLAVGIMVAVILNGKVAIRTGEDPSGLSGQDSAITFTDEDLNNQEDIPEDMEKMGNVYYDKETGTYYILKEDAE